MLRIVKLVKFAPIVLGCLALLVAAAPARAQCDKLLFRIWSPQGSDSFHDYGQEIVLEPGSTVHLYVSHRSRSRNPYSTSASLGYPADFGYRGIDSRQVAAILRLQPQNQQDQAAGRIVLTANQAGQTAIAYSIYGVSQDGAFRNLPAQCHAGLVSFRVAGASPPPQAAPQGRWPDGNWQTEWGVLSLSSRGQQIWGSYPSGTVQGTVDGGVVKGTWTNGQQSGPFELHLRPNRDGFDGWWGYSGAEQWAGRWDGTRTR